MPGPGSAASGADRYFLCSHGRTACPVIWPGRELRCTSSAKNPPRATSSSNVPVSHAHSERHKIRGGLAHGGGGDGDDESGAALSSLVERCGDGGFGGPDRVRSLPRQESGSAGLWEHARAIAIAAFCRRRAACALHRWRFEAVGIAVDEVQRLGAGAASRISSSAGVRACRPQILGDRALNKQRLLEYTPMLRRKPVKRDSRGRPCRRL